VASDDVEGGVGEEERGLEVGELLVGDGDVALDRGDRDGDSLAIEVGDGDGCGDEQDEGPGV
jgi:hypothetical protein